MGPAGVGRESRSGLAPARSLAGLRALAQPVLDLGAEAGDQPLVPDLIGQLAGESLQQQRLGRAPVEAARLQVEELVGVEAADGGAMAAGDIIGPSVFCACFSTRMRPWKTPVAASSRM